MTDKDRLGLFNDLDPEKFKFVSTTAKIKKKEDDELIHRIPHVLKDSNPIEIK